MGTLFGCCTPGYGTARSLECARCTGNAPLALLVVLAVLFLVKLSIIFLHNGTKYAQEVLGNSCNGSHRAVPPQAQLNLNVGCYGSGTNLHHILPCNNRKARITDFLKVFELLSSFCIFPVRLFFHVIELKDFTIHRLFCVACTCTISFAVSSDFQIGILPDSGEFPASDCNSSIHEC